MIIFYAVIDTNVLVSALLTSHSDAATVKVMEKIFTGEIIPLFSQEILDEYSVVLHREKFKFIPEVVAVLLDVMKTIGQLVKPSPSNETLKDMKDLPFYEVALIKQDVKSFLITGNIKHFPTKPFIVTPNEFLDILNRKNEQDSLI